MKKAVHILLLCALVPMAGLGEETLEQRKKRIMRKYLREANELSQVDWLVPRSADEELVADSEKFQPTDVGFERHEGAVIPPVMTRRSAAPFSAEKLTAADSDEKLSKDPYADPFALTREDESGDEGYSWKNRREVPGQRDRRSASDFLSESRNRYESRLDTGRNYRSTLTEQEGEQSAYDRFGSGGQEGVFGYRTPADQSASGLQPYRTYGSTPDEGLLLPTPTYRSEAEQQDALKPGQIPFRYRRLAPQQRESSWDSEQSAPTYRRYTEPLPYQQLKSREKAWDPTADDAYVDELKYKVHQ